MNFVAYVISYDVGTTGVKTCLYSIDDKIRLVAGLQEGYQLFILENGGAEQDQEEWWTAMCNTTHKVIEESGISPAEIQGISFCSQMQGLVLVDKEGNALRRPMSYMDQRAKEEIKKGIAYGIQIAGGNVLKVLKSVLLTGAVSTSVKDPVWKYKWVEAHEPEIFSKVYKWLDVKEYLILRCTGEFVMTEDSAYATFLYATQGKKKGWHPALCKLYGVNPDHLPKVIGCTDKVGGLTEKAASELGLSVGTPVFGGGGDATLIGLGAGCTAVGETHLYAGTSGWVSTVVDKQLVDVNYMIAATVGALKGRYNYFAEMETAGKCLEWVKDHLALDEINIYLKKVHVGESQESVYTSLYSFITDAIRGRAPGSGGVIFTPWLHGNRCPFEDPNAAGMFFNVHLETGKRQMIRAVIEGICFHLRWMLECQDKKIQTSRTLRYVGGLALSDVTCQILADITGRTVETVENPQNVGSVGAAAITGYGLGLIESLDDVRKFIPASAVYEPNPDNRAVYDKNYEVFKTLYKLNKKAYAAMAK